MTAGRGAVPYGLTRGGPSSVGASVPVSGDKVHHVGAAEGTTRRPSPTDVRHEPTSSVFISAFVEKTMRLLLSFMKPRELPAPTKPQTARQATCVESVDLATVLVIGWRPATNENSSEVMLKWYTAIGWAHFTALQHPEIGGYSAYHKRERFTSNAS
ncbi:hypothetical protein FHL15_004019 [Xylaria flabelliformis]|uniref:Uncharacterized protein n=1 Tax=Xylaria flabelliformis TaxID=2512241 RepID=A0A553I408_9PEZI|nr:hypothetical protein FHL15_004019 [Xylaria flabelliformis]